MLRRTLAHCSPTIVLTESSLATRVAGAGVKVTVGVGVSSVVWSALAHSIATGGGAVSIDTTGVGGARLQTTGGEWISNIVWSTLAHSSLTTVGAVSIDSTWILETRVQVALDKRI